MTTSPTIITSPPLLWSYTELSAGGYFKIEYLYLFCQILYYFCQRFFTSTWGLPSKRLYARALRHSFLYCFDINLLFLSYGTSFIPFCGFAIFGRVYILGLSDLINGYFYCARIIHRNRQPSFLVQ